VDPYWLRAGRSTLILLDDRTGDATSSRVIPNSEVQFRIQAFGTTDKTEFEEIGDKSLFRAFKYFSVNSVVLSISVVFRQVFLTQLRSSGLFETIACGSRKGGLKS